MNVKSYILPSGLAVLTTNIGFKCCSSLLFMGCIEDCLCLLLMLPVADYSCCQLYLHYAGRQRLFFLLPVGSSCCRQNTVSSIVERQSLLDDAGRIFTTPFASVFSSCWQTVTSSCCRTVVLLPPEHRVLFFCRSTLLLAAGRIFTTPVASIVSSCCRTSRLLFLFPVACDHCRSLLCVVSGYEISLQLLCC